MLTRRWNISQDSASDATNDDGNGGVILDSAFEYLGLTMIQRGGETIVAIANNIPPEGHPINQDDGRIGHGTFFINPSPGVPLRNAQDLIGIRFSEHHNQVDPTYRKPLGVFENFQLVSVTAENGRSSSFTMDDYVDQVTDREGTVTYGESSVVNADYFQGSEGIVLNEIEGGQLVENSGFRALTTEEISDARVQFDSQGIAGDYITGFALNADIVPVGHFSAALGAECANDFIAIDGVIGTPGIQIEKRVNGDEADTPEEAVHIQDGQQVTYTVKVTNTGDIAIDGDTLNVNDPNVNLSLNSRSDTGIDNILSPGEFWIYHSVPAEPTLGKPVTIDFDTDAANNPIAAGTFINNQYQALGITISAVSNNSDNPFGGMAFDTLNPTGDDDDLRTSTEGNVLIISEDGDQTDPDDDAAGGKFRFDFENPIVMDNIGILDLNRSNAEIRLYAGDQLIGQLPVEPAGINALQQVEIDELLGSPAITGFEISSRDSIAITGISFHEAMVENIVEVSVNSPEFQIVETDVAYYYTSGISRPDSSITCLVDQPYADTLGCSCDCLSTDSGTALSQI